MKKKRKLVRTIFGAYVAEVLVPSPEVTGMRDFSMRLLSDGEFDPAAVKSMVGKCFRVFVEETEQ